MKYSVQTTLRKRSLFLFNPVFLLAFISFVFSVSAAYGQVRQDVMVAHFIDVGQADATLLEFPCGAILIDAGAQGDTEEKKLVKYLKDFFTGRPDLHNTLDLVIVTHAHLDHNVALDNVANNFTIKRYIDNGLRAGSGRVNQKWLQDNAAEKDITYASYSYNKIKSDGDEQGFTDEIIDPLECTDADPEIHLLSGAFTTKPAGWAATAFSNGNNHSVVIKVKFGKASFLFTGDLETAGIETLLKTYPAATLDVDVLRVGHHGAANATTPEFLSATTPSYAVISCGKWYYGRTSGGNFTTYAYGHPRINILDQLDSAIDGERTVPIKIKGGVKSKVFKTYTVKKNIYATAWDKTFKAEAHADGTIEMVLDQ